MSEIQQTVAAQPVVVYSKSWCPFCTECKELLDSMEQPYTVVELDQRDDGDAVQAALLSLTRQRTVPNVFVGGQHLGGNDDTQAAPTNPAPAPAPDRRRTAGRTPNADPDRSPKQAAARSGRLAEMLAGSGSGAAGAAADAREVDLPASRARRVNLGLAVASPLVAAALFFAQRSSLLGVDPVTLLAKMEVRVRVRVRARARARARAMGRVRVRVTLLAKMEVRVRVNPNPDPDPNPDPNPNPNPHPRRSRPHCRRRSPTAGRRSSTFTRRGARAARCRHQACTGSSGSTPTRSITS